MYGCYGYPVPYYGNNDNSINWIWIIIIVFILLFLFRGGNNPGNCNM